MNTALFLKHNLEGILKFVKLSVTLWFATFIFNLKKCKKKKLSESIHFCLLLHFKTSGLYSVKTIFLTSLPT